MADEQERFPKEKRRSPRVGGAMVEYYIEGQESSGKNAFIKDVCIHGICIYTPESVEADKTIYLSVFLFGSEVSMKAEGRVVWHKPGEYVGYHNVGIEFSKMSKDDTQRLSAHIEANLQTDE
jgi:hypothetical protein